jgi:serine protease Do
MALLVAGLLGATSLAVVPVLAPAQAQNVFNHAPAEGFADLVERVMPAVVSVDVQYQALSLNEDGDDVQPQIPQNSPFRQFFDQFGPGFRFNAPDLPRMPARKAQGSGFFISEDGYIVTNNHVVSKASEVTVRTADGKDYRAKVVGTDAKTDLALLKVDSDVKFQFVEFADKDPRVGDWVIAVGNPFGLGGSVTTGIVSARGRDLGNGPYDEFLQIDAPINKGNSGGPAFNLKGEVIGVNTAIFSPSGGSVGIGFAIPASMARLVIDSLKEHGVVTRGWLGVQIQPVTDDLAESMGLQNALGAIVADVTSDSPALKAGLKTGDTIVGIGDEQVADPRDLARKVAMLRPDSATKLKVIRDGKEITVEVKIGMMPGDKEAAAKVQGEQQAPEPTLTQQALGLALEPAQDGQGVVVVAVEPGSPAADKRIRPGDVILEVGGIAVDDPAAFAEALKRTADSGQKRALLLIRSGDRQRFVALPTGRS